ncbi:hypothetical protein [Micromonospora marina]|uniref:hypothetical protein n=1 Tax=Micromonospora marina TaxID=307120 RepID=UPI003D70F747
MKVAFVGKGSSGKTTLAALFTRPLVGGGRRGGSLRFGPYGRGGIGGAQTDHLPASTAASYRDRLITLRLWCGDARPGGGRL